MQDLISRSIGPMIELKIITPGIAPAVIVDPNQLEMALLNLAVNARDAMPGGGILSITLDQKAIGEASDLGLSAGSYVRIALRDTGEGMDAETLARAVEPFFSTKGVGKGTGLGLSMVHGLAEQSGGVFRLESQVGVGTTAELWLPAANSAPELVARSQVSQSVTSPATILLVDDDALIAASTSAMLEDLGHHVVEAHCGREALAILDDGLHPDIVITDHAMPGMTGIDLAVHLRLRNPNLPILLTTGYAEVRGDLDIEFPRLGKPYTQEQLSSEIARLLPAHAAS
jgi:CheY-like chemotaxis protein